MIFSIRGRVLVLALLAQFLATSCAMGLAVWYVRRALWSSVDSELQARAVSLLALVGQADDDPYALDFDAKQMNLQNGDLFCIVDPHGRTLAGSSSWDPQHSRTEPGSGNSWFFKVDGITYRGKALIGTPILDQEDMNVPQLRVNLFYAMPVERTQARLAEAVRKAVLVGILSLLVSALLTWWAVGKGMAPLIELAYRADNIQAARAEFELPPGTLRNTELMPLGLALQGLAARVRAAFDRERQFLSDAAHELKTAVAIQKSTLQLLEQGKADEAEYREGIERALDDTARTERLVADMLLLSAIEHAQQSAEYADPISLHVSLEQSVQLAIDRLQPLAQIKAVVIELKHDGMHCVAGREEELCLLWTNLIENAIQHSPDSSRVTVEVSEAGIDECRVTITDCGSGIAAADLPHIFERFYRSDSSRSRTTGGFGLGLSIAKAIVEAMHGSIHVESTLQHGTDVKVILPKA
jgi:signal transduction histidine kinase